MVLAILCRCMIKCRPHCKNLLADHLLLFGLNIWLIGSNRMVCVFYSEHLWPTFAIFPEAFNPYRAKALICRVIYWHLRPVNHPSHPHFAVHFEGSTLQPQYPSVGNQSVIARMVAAYHWSVTSRAMHSIQGFVMEGES